jgi:hypothetical protein
MHVHKNKYDDLEQGQVTPDLITEGRRCSVLT